MKPPTWASRGSDQPCGTLPASATVSVTTERAIPASRQPLRSSRYRPPPHATARALYIKPTPVRTRVAGRAARRYHQPLIANRECSMEYRQLGRTDLKVSALCLGTMTWGNQNTQDDAFAQMDLAVSHGINFFDTAEMYAVPSSAETAGKTETIIGNWLARTGRRDDIVLATKATGPGDWMTHIRGGPRLNREHITQAVEGSLRRLQTDVIDLYQMHWPE